MTTFTSILSGLLAREPGRPLVTFYDEASGERIELSVTTYANWVAKTSSLLVDELGLERGDPIRVDLPAHWLGHVFLGAAWNAGLVVTDDERPAAVVTGPDGVERWAPYAGGMAVLACSLRPLGARFTEPLPVGVHDVGVEVWSQPDSFVPWDPTSPEDPALDLGGLRLTQEQMWEANPASPPGIASFTEPLSKGGSVVLVVNAGAERREAIASAERVTHRFPA